MTRPDTALLGRYAFQAPLKSEPDAPRWLVIDTSSGRRAVAAVVAPARLSVTEASKSITHRHLAGILDVTRIVDPHAVPGAGAVAPGSGVAVAEFVSGKTLHQHLAGKPMAPVKAVGWVLRLSEAVQAMHAGSAVHGAISPFAIVAEPEGRAIAPVLSQLVAPPLAAYCTPERLKGAAPAVSDDVWALCATLYTALTGQPPFEASSVEDLARQMLALRPKPLAARGVNEPVLSEILERGLTGDRRQRIVELAELTKLLDGWERDPRAALPKRPNLPRPAPKALMDIVGGQVTSGVPERDVVLDPGKLAAETGFFTESLRAMPPPLPVKPPPLPVSLPAALGDAALIPPELPPPDPALLSTADSHTLGALSRELPPPAPPRPLAMVSTPKRLSFNPFERKRRVWPLVVCAALASGVGVYVVVSATAAPSTPVPVATSAPTTEAPKKLAAKPVRDPAVEQESCVRSYFELDDQKVSENLAFVCGEGDFRELARSLFAKAPGGQQDVSRSELGWYELASTSIIRKSCCKGALPPVLPETPGWCEQLQTVVRRVADDSAKAGDLAPAARSFDKAVSCLFANRINKPYLYERAPSAANRRAFQQFLSRAAISEARR